MSLSTPLISIVIPIYNRAHLLAETLNSVFGQTYINWECILVDDGSTDGSLDLCREFLRKDNRFFLLNRSSTFLKGGNGARNEGLKNSNGDWIIFLDSDDLLTEFCLEERIKQLRINFTADMLLFQTGTFYNTIGDSDIVWNSFQEDNKLYSSLILRFVEQDMPWHTNGVLWKKSFLLKIGGWNEVLRAWQDWELGIRALNSCPLLYFSQTLPDNFYRLNVKGSIASQYHKLSYFKQIKMAIVLVEPVIISLNNKFILNRFKYLIFRNFIHRPIQIKFKKLPIIFVLSDFSFKCISKIDFLLIYFLEIFNKEVNGVKFIKKKIGSHYFNSVKANSKHLQTPVNQIDN